MQRVFDALDGLAEIEDPKTRALAAARVLKEWPEHSKALREVRRQAVLQLLEPEDASVRKVARELGVSPSTVQDIATGHSRWAKRPKDGADEASEE